MKTKQKLNDVDAYLSVAGSITPKTIKTKDQKGDCDIEVTPRPINNLELGSDKKTIKTSEPLDKKDTPEVMKK
jgi:hypothetical protein